MSTAITIQEIESALSLAQKYLIKTPLIYSPEFSEATGNEIYFKMESFQRTHAFKARGALNKVSSLSETERGRGVIAASSGNHALGVAYSSALFGIKATVVMPVSAPIPKVELAKSYGARVLFHGNTYDEALSQARLLAREHGLVLLSSFDDIKVIAGQGTIALEVLEILPDLDLFIAPIGGGGLVSGLGIVLADLGKKTEVIGVQAEGAPSMLKSVQAGKRIKLQQISTIADGIAVQQPGKLNFEYIQRYIKEIFTVSDEQILEAMFRMFRDMRVVVEPAAAAAPATLLFNKKFQKMDKKICCVITGGNVAQDLVERVVRGQLLLQNA